MTQRLCMAILILFSLFSMSITSQPVIAEELGNMPQTIGHAIHYFVFENQADGSILPAYYQAVSMSTPMLSLSEAQVTKALNQPSRNQQRLVVLLQGEDGEVVFRDVVGFSPWLRGEFHSSSPEQGIDGHFVRQESTVFVVRLPQVEAGRLILQNDQLEILAEFDLAATIASTPRYPVQTNSPAEISKVMSGSPANRVDLVVLGDGYTAAQEAQFMSDANAMLANFFSISPLAEYQNYYNLYMVATASNQSGSDHPPYDLNCGYYDPTCCGDPVMKDDPLMGQMVDTAFDSRYCAYYIHRLLVADDAKVYAAAGAAVPDWDQLLVIVNDTTYGGSGGTSLAVVSMASTAVQIAQHEYGHSFADLADEYTSAYPGYPPCSDDPDSPYSPCESNVTDITVREEIKWYPWILEDTQIPTPNNPIYQGLVGLFEGARYQTTDMYRSGYNCIMRALGQPFCQVPSQSYALKLYEGGWGTPVDGISLIEPESTLPVSTTISLIHPATQTFSAEVLSPVGGPPVEMSWLDNGIVISGVVTSTLNYSTSADSPGLHEITLQVRDVTTLVHPEMAGDALEQEHVWLVEVSLPITVSADPSAIFANGVSTSTITANVVAGDGLPKEGETVTFTTSLGSISPITATTDESGTATAILTSGVVSGTATVVASVSAASASVEVAFVDVNAPLTVTVNADPTVIIADGVSTSTIMATVTTGGIPEEGVVVTFTTTLGDINPITGTTDASGTVTAILTSAEVSGIATVTASVGSSSNSVDVEFIILSRTFLPLILKR